MEFLLLEAIADAIRLTLLSCIAPQAAAVNCSRSVIWLLPNH